MQILLIGATGFIGSHVCAGLLHGGHSVTTGPCASLMSHAIEPIEFDHDLIRERVRPQTIMVYL